MKMFSFTEAKQIPIIEYLSRLGFEPAYNRGTDSWYHSPLREERTPSFKVNTHRNVWYDHGSGEGGTILDLGAKLHQCSLSEFLQTLSDGNYNPLSFHRQPPFQKPENKIEIINVRELSSEELFYYLRKRGISKSIAKEFCKEVDFSIRKKIYTAIGFPNQVGAYELRNHWFKGSSSPKDISHINNKAEKLSLLEGFIDFLSVVQLQHKEIKELVKDSDFLILNSLRLINRCLPLLQSHKEVNLFLDNDQAAKEAKESLMEKGIRFNDASILYSKHKDVNEYLIASNQLRQVNDEEQTQTNSRKRRGMRM